MRHINGNRVRSEAERNRVMQCLDCPAAPPAAAEAEAYEEATPKPPSVGPKREAKVNDIAAPTIAAKFGALALGTMITVTGAGVFAVVAALEVSVVVSVAVTASLGGEESHIFLLGPNGLVRYSAGPTAFSSPTSPTFASTSPKGILGPISTQETLLPNAFGTMTLDDPTWNMDTCASSYLNSHTLTKPSPIPSALLSVSPSTWHERLGHPSEEKGGVNCDDTFSPVVKPAIICTVPSLALSRNWPICQLDVKNAFLNGDLFETVYMYQPSRHLVLGFNGLQVMPYGLVFRQVDVTPPYSFIDVLLDMAHMAKCNPTRTIVDAEFKLGSDGDPVSDLSLYCSLAGGLQYLTFTCPDISYRRLQIYASSTCSLVAYSDAYLAGCPTTRRYTSDYCVFLGDNLLSWSSKRQHTRSRSSAEVEYKSVSNAVAKTAWLRNLLRELHTPLLYDTLVYCDNVSAIYLTANRVQHQQTKHIEIDIHFARDMIARGQVRVLHVPSRYQYANIFTKGLPSALFEEFHTSLSVHPFLAQTAGEC
nr:ribonuclease H-like domain-containing protein [Tanacetum cinerariifolium]